MLWEDPSVRLFDVRTAEEWALCRMEGAVPLDDEGEALLRSLPRNTPIVFQCHHGIRSQHAARHYARQGFSNLHNLAGGIEAWSLLVDPSVPRYGGSPWGFTGNDQGVITFHKNHGTIWV